MGRFWSFLGFFGGTAGKDGAQMFAKSAGMRYANTGH